MTQIKGWKRISWSNLWINKNQHRFVAVRPKLFQKKGRWVVYEGEHLSEAHGKNAPFFYPNTQKHFKKKSHAFAYARKRLRKKPLVDVYQKSPVGNIKWTGNKYDGR